MSVTVLGIETSCDETAAAVVRRAPDGSGEILANVVRSQWTEHAAFGGVVPEIAARAHLACLDEITARALGEAGARLSDIDLVAATAGPGLVGGLLVGLSFGRALAIGGGRPFAAVNHLEGHALTAGLTDNVRPPYLLLLVSGGHTQTIHVAGVGHYRRLGTTIDDALGEAFDKTAKLLELGQPGGPAVEAMARSGRGDAVAFPRPMRGRSEPDFSFAGLKTAVRRAAQARAPLNDQAVSDICASFQDTVRDVVMDRIGRALEIVGRDAAGSTLVIAGGVAANQVLRAGLEDFAAKQELRMVAPPIGLCTDNAAMIAWAAAERRAAGLDMPGFDASPRARWPLDEAAAPKVGSGRLGAKA